jgi:hypothetical protein
VSAMSFEPDSGPVSGRGATELLVDAHVHLHAGFDEVGFFDATLANFGRAAEALRVRAPWAGILVLTEIAGTDRFGRLLQLSDSGLGGGWRVETTSEATSVRLRCAQQPTVINVVAGRQIQTAEGLEVLAFPHRGPLPDGQSIRDVIHRVSASGALSVIPWGFGKWWGRRGHTVDALLTQEPRLPFFLADTGHRPARMPRPPQLTKSERLGRPTLTGSDPLPLKGEESRAGSCCFRLSMSSSMDRPALRLTEAIAALNDSPPNFERRVGFGRFGTTQLAMQLRKLGR